MATPDELKDILNSPKGKVCQLLQSYIDKHPESIPKKHIKSINTSLLKKLYEACQFTMKKNNMEHIFVLIQIIRNIVEKEDLRLKLVDVTELRNFICIVLYQYLHNIFKNSKKRKSKADKSLIVWASAISCLSKHLHIVQSVSENIYLMMDLLLNHDVSLELRRELSECLVHLSQHASQKLQSFFLANSEWKSVLQRLMEVLPNLGDITSQIFYMTLFTSFIKTKQISHTEYQGWFPSDTVAKAFKDLLQLPPSKLRKGVFDCVLYLNKNVEQPTVFTFEIEQMKYGTYEPEYVQPYIHFGRTSLQFEISYPGEKEPSLLEIYYDTIKTLAIHASSNPPSISIILTQNDVVEMEEYYSTSNTDMNRIIFSMKDKESLKKIKRNIRPMIKDCLPQDKEKGDSETNQSEQSMSEDNPPPEINANAFPTKKFSSTPKVAIPRRQAFSEKRPENYMAESLPNWPSRIQKQYSQDDKENFSPIHKLNLSDDVSEKDLEDWDKIAQGNHISKYSSESQDNEDEEMDSDFEDLNLNPRTKNPRVEMNQQVRKRKRSTLPQLEDGADEHLHKLFEQIHDVIDKKRLKRRKIEESLGMQTQQAIDQKIEEVKSTLQSKRIEMEHDYKERMNEYRNQIASITSDMRTSYSKFQTLLKSKTKTLKTISSKIQQTKSKYEGRVSQFDEQSVNDIKRLEDEIKAILEQYEQQIDDMRAVGDSALKDVLKSFISTFQLQ